MRYNEPMHISFLIPCYQVEKYISECLDSIFSIPLRKDEFEVLCFDDQSSDQTLSILKKYAHMHDNMRVLCANSNVGPGGGRNRLFSIAKGEYVWFVDGDDLIIPEIVGVLKDKVKQNNLDVLVFGYTEWNQDKTQIASLYSLPNTNVDSGLQLADKIFAGGLVNNMGYPVRFLIRREYLSDNGILFPENMRYGEDTVWMAKVVLSAQRMMSISQNAYIYWHHDDSTSGTLKRVYPGRIIYEKCILTSHQLLEYVKDLQYKFNATNNELFMEYADNIEKFTSSHYINNLPIMLSRSTRNERCIFYNMFSSDSNADVIKIHANLMTRILLLPVFGRYISEIVAIVYNIKHNTTCIK